MVKECIVGDVADVHLQLFQIADAEDLLLRVGISDDEIAEAEVLLDGAAQILGEGL